MNAITEPFLPYLDQLRSYLRRLSPQAEEEFDQLEQLILCRSLVLCGLAELPRVAVGDPQNSSGEMICQRCGHTFFAHPMDWRVIGYGEVPFLNVLCDGRRVKL